MPRALGQYDFGPAPVMGGWTDPSAAAGRVWGQTIASIGGQVGSFVQGFKWTPGNADLGTKGSLGWSR